MVDNILPRYKSAATIALTVRRASFFRCDGDIAVEGSSRSFLHSHPQTGKHDCEKTKIGGVRSYPFIQTRVKMVSV